MAVCPSILDLLFCGSQVGSSLCRSHRAPVSRVGNTVLTGNQLWSILLHVLYNAASQVQPETTVAVKHRVSFLERYRDEELQLPFGADL